MSLHRQTIAFALILGFAPSVAGAQSARTAGDTPSRNRETRIQHDSLAVHFVRTPKAKPATRSSAAATGIDPRKFGGKPAPAVRTLPAETPLPVKARTTKP